MYEPNLHGVPSRQLGPMPFTRKNIACNSCTYMEVNGIVPMCKTLLKEIENTRKPPCIGLGHNDAGVWIPTLKRRWMK